MREENIRTVTLLGTPLSQSFAARMQNAAYAAMGEALRYTYTETDEKQLPAVVERLRGEDIPGFAVTKPNKVTVLPLLDELDPLCEKMGAANTVVRLPDGKLKGYNTDGIGFYTALTRETGMEVSGRTFFCVGAGGAGRAICSVLAHYGAGCIYITDLYDTAAKALAEEICEKFAPVARFVPHGGWSDLGDCDCIINASGVGMGESVGESPVPKELLRSAQLCFDACYNPARTQFLLDAQEQGCPVMNGLGMSLYQGVAQIELWTGREAPVEVMRQELLDIISGK